ncbi:hypothetical protein ABW21_db0205003 [Orbilia brochopaga]|nr:hypothetical protein ABW21_db0205003 [Drechslerella brochopaga]
MWINRLGRYARAVAFTALLGSTTSYAQITITDYELDSTVQTYDSSLIQPFITALRLFIDVVDLKYPLLPTGTGVMTAQDRLQAAVDMTNYFRAIFSKSTQASDPAFADTIETLVDMISLAKTKIEAQRDAEIDIPGGLWTKNVGFVLAERNVWTVLIDFYQNGAIQCSATKCAPKDVVIWLFSGESDAVADRWQFLEQDLTIRMGVIRQLAITLQETRAAAVAQMGALLQEYQSHPYINVNPTAWITGSFRETEGMITLYVDMLNGIADAMQNILMYYQLGQDD